MQLTAQPTFLRPQLPPAPPQTIEPFGQRGNALTVDLDATVETAFLCSGQSFIR
ncbi:hypothetical protein HBA53_25565 (plasmid) [Rhodococcus pyridinivorans]|uniref:hypothetical protein n=1 Tax=Rhodococcus pyridinivorans TaxID=103816 RepID=UPI001C2F20EC|nr:hypothetical protein [Rhodococcus pyridinivorans]QXF84407.1 hypothetical protein HBA53_25565 [Rhodococcus pyridinivorans]